MTGPGPGPELDNKEESETMSGTTPPSTTPVENEISEKESEYSEETTIKS